MSNKTIFKRIALVTVAALGAGFLTITPASAANNLAAGTATQPAPATNILNIATAPSTTGAAIVTATPEDGTADATDNKSLGLLSNSTTLGVSSLSSTATMRSDGEIVFYTKTENDKAATFVIEGGAKFITYAAEGSEFSNMNAARTQFVTGKATASTQIAFSVKPDTGTTSFSVSMYVSASLATIDQTKVDAVQAGTTSKGTLTQRYTVTVASGASSGTYSDTYSYVQGVTSATTVASSDVDQTDSLNIANAASSVAYIAIKLQDGYEVSLDNVGALSITGTGGAGIYYAGASSAGTPVNTSAVSNVATGTITVARPSALANKAFTTTVTITYNGVVVGTKTVKFQGEVAKMNIVQYKNLAAVGATSTYQGQIEYLDDAGNVLLPTSGTSVKSSTLNQYVTSASIGDWADSADPVSYYDVVCGGTDGSNSGVSGGSANLVFRHTNPFSGSIIETAAVKVTCAGDPVTYTAALDKAVYAPGEVATLTITGKDVAGNLANGEQNIQTTTSGREFFITAPQLTVVTAISTTSVKFSSGAGIKTYKFTVGNTEGSYNMIVGAPEINNLLLGGANQTVAYKIVAPSTGAVTNAEVLAAIVKLIASINKQIRALQKSLKR